MVKLLLFIALLLLAVVAMISAHGPMNDEQQKSKMMEFKQQCAEELKISPEDMNKLKSGELLLLTNSHPSIKCFAKCFLEKSGIMADGKINEANAMEKIGNYVGADQAANVLNQCKEAGGADPCEIGTKFLECLHKNKP